MNWLQVVVRFRSGAGAMHGGAGCCRPSDRSLYAPGWLTLPRFGRSPNRNYLAPPEPPHSRSSHRPADAPATHAVGARLTLRRYIDHYTQGYYALACNLLV